MWSLVETLIFVPLVGVVSPFDIISSLRLMNTHAEIPFTKGEVTWYIGSTRPPSRKNNQSLLPIAFRGFGDGRLEISQDEGVLATMYATRVLLKRSVWKGPHLVPLPIVWPKSPGDKVPPVRTQARSATILPNFVGLKFEVHNGKDYHEVTITEDMVGHKLGEFSPTRKPNIWDKR